MPHQDETDQTIESVPRDSDLHSYVNGRLDEAQVERGRHEGQWQVNDALYMGLPVKRGRNSGVREGQSSRISRNYNSFTAPITQGAVIATTSIQTETPPRWSYVGRETNEPPEVYFRPSGAAKTQEVGAQFDPDQLAGKMPITEEVFNQLMAATRVQDTGEVQSVGDGGEAVEAPITNQIPIFSEDDFVLVTDQLAAEALTQESNSEFDMISGDEIVRTNILQTNINGHDDTMVQWMPQKRRFGLTGLYPYNVWIDPEANSMTDAEFVVIRQELTLAAAKKEYPDLAGMLEEQAQAGTMATMNHSGDLGGKSRRNTERQFVERVTMWERNSPYPMSVEEAMELGLVQPDIVNVAVGLDEQGQVITEPQQSRDEEGNPLFTVEGDEGVIAEGDEGWPDRFGIRQIELLADFVLLDQETEFSDIPISRNKNIPIQFSPYAMGEPQRLEDLQDLYNSLLTIFINHFKQFKNPQLVVPASVLKEMGLSVQDAYKKSIQMWALPDKLLAQFGGGDIIKVLNVPQLNQAAMSMFNIVRDEMDRVSGLNDTLRGDTKSDQSARLFSEATAAARGPIGYKAQHTNDYLKRIGKIVANLIIDFLPTSEWVRRNNKYPAPIIESMRRRLKRVGFDVVPIVGASGGKQQKVDRISGVMQQGVQTPTLLKNLMDAMDVDDAEEIANELRQMQQAQPTV